MSQNFDMLNRHVCRVCLRVGTSGVSLDEGRRKSMFAVISNCPEMKRTTRKTPKVDHLPSWICSQCDRRLPSAATFVALCRRSEQKLLRAQRLQIPFDTLYQKYNKTKAPDRVNLVKEEPSPAPSSVDSDHWDNDDYEIVCQKVPLPIKIKIENNVKIVKEENEIKTETKVKKESKIKKAIRANTKEENDDDYTPKPSKNIIKYKSGKIGRPSKCYKCKLCGEILRGIFTFKAHLNVHCKERAYKCPHCNAAYMSSGILKNHIDRVHINPKPKPKYNKNFVCHQCGKTSVSNSALKKHLETHDVDLKVPCDICKHIYKSQGRLKYHQRTMHSDKRPDRKHQCDKCDLRFDSRGRLQRHMTVHVDVRTFKCEICGKMLKSTVTLRQHKDNVHNQVKPHICDICGAALVTKDNLKQHFRAIHSNKPGMCRICNKDVPNLRLHKKSHSSEMIFRCHLCPRRYGLKRSLTAHMKTHTLLESAKFVCDINNCDKRFTTQSLLDIHVSQYHSEHTPYICQYCSKGFYTLPEMSKHVKNAHFRQYEDFADNDLLINS
ncbi:zinc finger X-chromosomal protein-like [Arctopsyche grandis]|uniref:zinc finger X-chromosomal protein-like n=1 Tax=Arctopsyche grandis TaxID=121162 RepID=UPI00406D9F36